MSLSYSLVDLRRVILTRPNNRDDNYDNYAITKTKEKIYLDIKLKLVELVKKGKGKKGNIYLFL